MARAGLVVGAALLATGRLYAQVAATSQVAAAPPMGWNSWDSYGLTVNEGQFRENVAVQVAKLKASGWTYSVIDEGWFMFNPQDRGTPEKLQYLVDDNGRYLPVPERFASATVAGKNTGFAELARWVHGQGMQFGIHIVRGIPRESVKRNTPIEGSSFHATDAADQNDACPWDPTNWGIRDTPAGQAWYDSLLRQYAAWGVDFLKVDCIADHPYKVSEIKQIRLAITRSGRPMVLSLSPGPTSLEHATEVGQLSQMWRISNDIWDVWQTDADFPKTVKAQFDLTAAWAPYAKPGNWPDADMLPLGSLAPHPDIGPGARKSRLTADEQRTMFSLWTMARSPLVLGSNLTLLDAATLALITNRELIRIDQHATASREVLRKGELIAWTADLPDGSHALGLFNRGDVALDVREPLGSFQLAGRKMHLRDVETGHAEQADAVSQTLRPHASVVYLVSR